MQYELLSFYIVQQEVFRYQKFIKISLIEERLEKIKIWLLNRNGMLPLKLIQGVSIASEKKRINKT